MNSRWKLLSILAGLSVVGIGSLAEVTTAQENQVPATKIQTQDSAKEETQEAKPKDEKKQREPIYDEKADAEQQIQAALAKAKKENQRVILQWGANWCGWCYLLHDKMNQDPKIARKLMYDYQVVLIDVGRFDKQTELLKKYDADIKGHGVPYLTVLDADGKVIVNQETSSLETDDRKNPGHDGDAVMAFLEKHQPTPLVATDVLESAFSKAQASDRLVLVHFGAPWCGWCHYLEDWLAEDEQAILHKQLFDVKIDQDRMDGGQELLEKYCKKTQGIPWFAIIDPETQEVIVDSTAPGGNVGFPSTDAEIDYFGQMLKACGERFTDQQIDDLKASLVANRSKREAARAERMKAAQ